MIATTFEIACSFGGMETAFRGSQGASSVKRTHLDGRPAGDGGLAPPLQRLVEVNRFQHPKTADVLLGPR